MLAFVYCHPLGETTMKPGTENPEEKSNDTETNQERKQPYQKPKLEKHSKLTDITGQVYDVTEPPPVS